MSMSKNIARLAVTAGLTAALSFGGVMAPVTMAFAEDAAATTYSITINKIAGNEDVEYKAYQIFKAKVTDTENGKTAQDITWANDKLGAEVVKAIKEKWTGYNDLATMRDFPKTPRLRKSPTFSGRTRTPLPLGRLTGRLGELGSRPTMSSTQSRML